MNLPERLFWDIDIDTLDYADHAHFIIKRVVQRGMIADWVEIKRHYGLEFIKQEILKMRDLDPKTHHFFSHYFGIEKSRFRCSDTRPFNH